MDFARVIARVKAILATPRTEWPLAAAEPATVNGLYTGYIAIVAALPVIASFIKGSLIGTSLFGITVRTPVGTGIAAMVVSYLLALAVAYLVAMIINALAPTFDGQKNMVQALKTVAYAWTASWIAGIAVIVPWLGWLIALAGAIYAIYLLYLGLPHTMKCPVEKAAGYTVVSVIIAVVLSWIVGLVITGMVGGAALGGMQLGNSSGDKVSIDGNSALGKLAAMGQHVEQASKELDAAHESGDGSAQAAAMGKMLGAVTGNDGSVEALSADQVKAFIPDSVLGLKRSGLSAQRTNAMGMQVTEASADYGDDNGKRISLQIADAGTTKGLMAMAAAMAPEQESQTEHGYDKTYTADGRMVHEAWDNASKSGEFSVVVGKRFTVKASGDAGSIDELKQAVASVDLAKLESLKDAGVKPD